MSVLKQNRSVLNISGGWDAIEAWRMGRRKKELKEEGRECYHRIHI